MPWEKNYNETEVLERAMHAFWARGYEATSMRDLVEATGINRGSIYAAYSNKHTLFMEALRHYDKVHRADYLDRISKRHTPRDTIIAAFEGACKAVGRKGVPGGCLLVNTVIELSPHDAEVRDFVHACLSEVEDFFFLNIEAGKRDGTIKTAGTSRETAQALLCLFLGVRVLTRGNPRKAAMDAITSQVGMMLE